MYAEGCLVLALCLSRGIVSAPSSPTSISVGAGSAMLIGVLVMGAVGEAGCVSMSMGGTIVSTCSHSNFMLHSTLTLPALGWYIQCAALLMLKPTNHASLALPSSLELVGSWTQAFCPYSQEAMRSGLHLVSASYEVDLSRALVDVQFFSQTTCIRASAHSPFGNWATWSMARTCSRSVRFSLSATLFSWGVSCTVSLCSVPCLARWVLNVPLRYSLPRSDRSARNLVLCWVQAQASNPR